MYTKQHINFKHIESDMSSVSPDRDGKIRGGSNTTSYAKITLVVVSSVTVVVFIAFCTVLGLLIKEKIGGNSDEGQESQPQVSCTCSYTRDPVLGCYRVFKGNAGPKPNLRTKCTITGGQMLLIKSALEASAASSILIKESVESIWIQGTRSSVTSPWLTDDKKELPYIKNNIVHYGTALELALGKDNTYIAQDADSYGDVICTQ